MKELEERFQAIISGNAGNSFIDKLLRKAQLIG